MTEPGPPEAFDRLVAGLDPPMFIVTTCVGEERAGCLVGFATQTSIDPSRFLVCLSHRNRSYRTAAKAGFLAVHVVPATAGELAQLFGGRTGDEIDKFARCSWYAGPHGMPILDACDTWFVGRVITRVDAGDHDAFLLEPVAAHAATPEPPLTLRQAEGIDPGHAA